MGAGASSFRYRRRRIIAIAIIFYDELVAKFGERLGMPSREVGSLKLGVKVERKDVGPETTN